MKRECAGYLDLRERYLDGELRPEEFARLAEHLRACSACRREVEAEGLLRATFRSLPSLSCPPATLETIAATAAPRTGHRAASGRPPWRRRRLWLALPAAAAMLVLAIMIFWTQNPQPPRQTSVPPAAQALAARQQAEWSLALTLRLIGDAQRESVADVFGHTVPQAVRSSLHHAAPLPEDEGGRG
jgi:predicted anti-sigma-YlaC factor YlaD